MGYKAKDTRRSAAKKLSASRAVADPYNQAIGMQVEIKSNLEELAEAKVKQEEMNTISQSIPWLEQAFNTETAEDSSGMLDITLLNAYFGSLGGKQMNGPNSIRSRWGFPSLNDADWKSKHLPSSSGNKGWESYGDPTTTAIGPAFPMNTAFANESVALRKGTSSQAVPGASGNNMKVGMNAAANAQSKLTNTKMVYQSPEISNVKEVYNSNNDFKVNSFDQQPMDYSVNVTAPEEEEIFNVMSGSGQDMHAENLRYGESLAMHGGTGNQPKRSKVTPIERPKYALAPQEAEILQPGEKYSPDLSMENIEQLPSTFDENLSIPPQAPATTATPPATTASAGGGTDKAAGKVSKLGTAAAIGLPLIAGISTHQKLQDTIGSLKDQRRSVEGALGNMANEEYATIRASRDSLSEERRQIGALEGDRLYGQ